LFIISNEIGWFATFSLVNKSWKDKMNSTFFPASALPFMEILESIGRVSASIIKLVFTDV